VKRSAIEARARGLLEDHGLLDMAVDPIRLANALGVKVYNAKFGDDSIHGLLAVREGRPSIYVNADHAPVRKRFTVAHELGHLVLHLIGGDKEFIDNADNFRTPIDPEATWTPERRQEWEANAFAAALLMPEKLIRQKWAEIADPDGMARWFQVSPTAMGYRLDGLGLVPA
jgi:Zn-dependent peptidase ImmA (M78 family)